eukprot:3946619-Pyramimonas_sp.AAC.1
MGKPRKVVEDDGDQPKAKAKAQVSELKKEQARIRRKQNADHENDMQRLRTALKREPEHVKREYDRLVNDKQKA